MAHPSITTSSSEKDSDDVVTSSPPTREQTYDTDNVDLEKHPRETAPIRHYRSNSIGTGTGHRRMSRTESLIKCSTGGTASRGRFSHPLSHVKTSPEQIVEFDGPDDPYRPINWPFRKKVITTALYGFTTMGSTWASAIYAPAVDQIAERFEVGREVSLLGVSLLMFGFGLGPLLWAPVSELYGRKMAVLIPYFIAICFTFGTATAENIQTVLITRFFAGVFGSAPVTNTGGVLGDIWSPAQRGNALVGYAMTLVGGPLIGPIAGGAIVNSYLEWRWTEYVTAFMQILVLTLDILILDETYPPALLVAKARRLRHETGNWALHARHEEWDVSLRELSNKYLKTPFRLLATPICFLMALYASFVYGLLYLCLSAVPIEFAGERGWGPVTSELPFMALLLGVILGGCTNIFNNKFYIRNLTANSFRPVPEARLPPMMIGSIFFSIGLFIFGWTSSRHIFWLCPCIGLVLMGLGFFTIFQAALNYLIDTFQKYAASAVAANTFLRSAFAGVFPLFATQMFNGMGIDWASSLLGFVAAAMIPIPYLFYIYGSRIRGRGKYSAEAMS